MATTIFFSACMSVIVYFFGLAGQMSSPSAWIYAAFMIALFARMILTKQYSRYRRIFQVTFAVLFMISFIGILYDERGSMSMTLASVQEAQTPFCQIVIPAILIPFALTKTVIFPARMAGHFASVVGMLLIWFLVSLTIGRGWCSWVCYYGGWEEGFSRAAKKSRVKLLSRNRDLRAFQFAFLFFIVLASLAFMSSVYCEWFCPFKLVTEYSPITDIPSLIATVVFIGLFLGLVIVLPFLTRKRFQCSTLCPFGAFQSLLDRVSGYRIAIDTEKCVGCLKCAEACQFCAIDVETITAKKGQPEITCAKCGECISVCPTAAIGYEFSSVLRRRKKGHSCERPAAGKFLQDLLDPQYLFVFTAFTFSVMISNKFVPDALDRIFRLLAGGVR